MIIYDGDKIKNARWTNTDKLQAQTWNTYDLRSLRLPF
jgi:hypothetical protein